MTKTTKANIGEASEKVATLLQLKESECDWKVCNHILRMMWPCPVHNAPAVSLDALVVKISLVFQAVATGAYYPKLAFENHKIQYVSWLLRSDHVKTNIFGNRMTKLTL